MVMGPKVHFLDFSYLTVASLFSRNIIPSQIYNFPASSDDKSPVSLFISILSIEEMIISWNYVPPPVK